MIVVTDIALANQQARQVLERILGVGRIDLVGYFVRGDAFDRRRNLRGQRGRPGTDHGNGAERLDGCIRAANGAGRARERQCEYVANRV